MQELMDFLENLASLFVYNPDEPLIFSSGSFLVLFLAFIIIYAGIKERKVLTSVFVVAFSLFFYYKSSGLHVILLVATTILTYFFGYLLSKTENESNRKLCLAVGIIPGLGALAYFKYTNFFITNLNQLSRLTSPFSILLCL